MSFPSTAISSGSSLQILPNTAGSGGVATNSFVSMNVGTFVANGTTPVTVADTGVTAASIIVTTLKTVGGTVSASPPNVLTITPATGFTIGALASDTSTYNWLRIG